jgi:hypothetical protein
MKVMKLTGLKIHIIVCSRPLRFVTGGRTVLRCKGKDMRLQSRWKSQDIIYLCALGMCFM